MQKNAAKPLQYALRLSAAKHNRIPHAASAALNLDTAIPLRSVQSGYTNCSNLQLQSRIKNIISAKIEKNCGQSTIRNCHAAITIRFTILSCKAQ